MPCVGPSLAYVSNFVLWNFEDADDSLAKFQYTFFDAFEHNNGVPKIPITPFPTLYTVPLFRPQNNTMELTAANFFYTHPQTQVQAPLDVYLGNMGPLKSRVYQSVFHTFSRS
jgi:recombining binding protein (suppressor of hairless)